EELVERTVFEQVKREELVVVVEGHAAVVRVSGEVNVLGLLGDAIRVVQHVGLDGTAWPDQVGQTFCARPFQEGHFLCEILNGLYGCTVGVDVVQDGLQPGRAAFRVRDDEHVFRLWFVAEGRPKDLVRKVGRRVVASNAAVL
ncbi:unnamed protein product, partial [Ixodes pacificus]